MDKKLKAKWVKALMSGKYQQGIGALRNGNNEYCCLGVLNTITSNKFYIGNDCVLEADCGIPREIQDELTVINDEGIPFPVIAGFIQENL